MVLAMCAHITFDKTDSRNAIELYRCTSVKSETSWKNIINTATIVLPRNVKDFDKMKVKNIFKRGDAVTVRLGYNGTLNEEFKGYIVGVSADIPISIKLEDEMYKIKRLPVNYSNNNCYLPDMIRHIAPGYDCDVAEYHIGSVRYAKMTVGAVLQKLKDDYKLYSYFQNGKLIVGKIYSDQQNTIDIDLDRVIENNLEYKTKDDKQIQIEATSTLVKGDKIKVTVGDAGGEVRQLTYFNIKDKEQVKQLAQKDYDKYMAPGFEGNIETLGMPVIHHGDKLNIKSGLYPDRNGLYYADSVTVVWEKAKYHRTIDVGQKVTSNAA